METRRVIFAQFSWKDLGEAEDGKGAAVLDAGRFERGVRGSRCPQWTNVRDFNVLPAGQEMGSGFCLHCAAAESRLQRWSSGGKTGRVATKVRKDIPKAGEPQNDAAQKRTGSLAARREWMKTARTSAITGMGAIRPLKCGPAWFASIVIAVTTAAPSPIRSGMSQTGDFRGEGMRKDLRNHKNCRDKKKRMA